MGPVPLPQICLVSVIKLCIKCEKLIYGMLTFNDSDPKTRICLA